MFSQIMSLPVNIRIKKKVMRNNRDNKTLDRCQVCDQVFLGSQMVVEIVVWMPRNRALLRIFMLC